MMANNPLMKPLVSIGRGALRGLAIVLPILITLGLAQWILATIETLLSPVLIYALPEGWYIPGMAIVGFLILCVAIGISARWSFIARLWQIPGRLLMQIPGVRQIHGTVQDLFEVMSGKNFNDEAVVMVTLPNSEIEVVGIVTKKGDSKDDRMAEFMDDEQLAVFLPMTYNVGGYLIMVPKSCTRSIDMKPAEALQLVLSGGLGKGKPSGKR